MVHEFELPDVGEGLTEAEIVSWLVEPGDAVSEDQPVAEVETDKAVVEVPAPVNGSVRELLADPGEMVPVGDVIITFDTDEQSSSRGRPSADDGDGDPVQDERTEPDAAAAAGSDEPAAAGADPEPDSEPGADSAAADPTESAEAADAAEVGELDGRVFAAPSARRLARELGVDIGVVAGSGPGGRVTEADVSRAAENGQPAGATAGSEADAELTSATQRVDANGTTGGGAAETTTPNAAVDATADRERTLAAPATRKFAEEEGVDLDAVPTDETKDGEAFVSEEHVREYAEAQRRAQAADAETVAANSEASATDAGTATGATATAARGDVDAEGEGEGGDERLPYRGVRQTIGEQMERSKFTAPHVTHHDEVDVTRLVEARGRLKDRAEERGTKLTYMPFVFKAVVAGLREHPILNSQLDEEAEEIIVRGDYNIGVATATDDGLMVPVVEGADRKGMLELADEMRELIDAARDRSIARSDMQGGTFTVTNFGAIGGEYATPIINYPETAILGLGAIKDRPWVVDGEVEARKVMTLSLSIDHRVIDGADAAQFVNTVKEYLEEPELLLLE
ncbi:branched-chain alpha-keto acid dehydrogenase subunit E2 [Halobacteriales archaeon QS_4_69_225]|nr:MAG: branched-chain alpha-keto acid dehydrogenase subunit E2 [Halobacteriales archaeon QS_4_69_225]